MPLPEDIPDYAVYLIGDALFLHFPGHLGGAAKADIALDDIKFLSSTCDCKLHHIITLSVILCSVTPSEAAPKPDTTPTTVPPTGSLPIPALAQTSFPYILLSHVSLQCLQPRRLRRRHQRNPQSRHLINKITFTHPVFQDGWNCDFEEMPLTRCRWDNSLGGKVLWEPTSGGDNPQVIFCYG